MRALAGRWPESGGHLSVECRPGARIVRLMPVRTADVRTELQVALPITHRVGARVVAQVWPPYAPSCHGLVLTTVGALGSPAAAFIVLSHAHLDDCRQQSMRNRRLR